MLLADGDEAKAETQREPTDPHPMDDDDDEIKNDLGMLEEQHRILDHGNDDTWPVEPHKEAGKSSV